MPNSEVGDGLIGLLVLKELPAELGALKCNEGAAEDQFIEMQVVGGASCRDRRPFCATGDRTVALRGVEGPSSELGALNDLQEINLIAGRLRIFVPGSVPSQRYRINLSGQSEGPLSSFF